MQTCLLAVPFILLWILCSGMVAEGNKFIVDSLLTSEHIYDICTVEPNEALKLLDEAETRKSLSQFDINYLRNLTYNNGLSMYSIALIYAQKAYQSGSVQEQPHEMLNLIDVMVCQYNEIGNYKESISYAIQGIALARKLKNKSVEANMILYIGINKRYLGLKAEANRYIDRAIKMQEKVSGKSKNWKEIDNTIYSYGYKITNAFEDKDYRTVIDLLPKYEELMKQLEECPYVPKGMYDSRAASGYVTFASVFAEKGELSKAEQFYRKYLATDYASSADGKPIRIEYLLITRQYEKALSMILEEKQKMIQLGDTVNYTYIHYVLEYATRAYAGLNNYKGIADTYKQMYTISDSLNVREKQNAALELATVYKTKEKDSLLFKQSADLRLRNIFIVSLVSIVVLMIVLLYRSLYYSRVVKKKNIAMVERINELLSYQAKLQKAESMLYDLSSSAGRQKNIPMADNSSETEECSEEEENKILFDKLHQLIVSDKLFLNPGLSRDELAQIIHVNKNRFAKIIQDNAGVKLTEYLNELRLSYAIALLNKEPNYTFQSVAQDSGFVNMGTFYRLFKEKVGMTPSEYKSTSQSLKNNYAS